MELSRLYLKRMFRLGSPGNLQAFTASRGGHRAARSNPALGHLWGGTHQLQEAQYAGRLNVNSRDISFQSSISGRIRILAGELGAY